jgi:hypothetical protein
MVTKLQSQKRATILIRGPAKLDIKQVIVPEYLIKHLSFVNGDQRQTFVDALLVYETARRSVMENIIFLQGLASALPLETKDIQEFLLGISDFLKSTELVSHGGKSK